MRHLDGKQMRIIMESTPRDCRAYVKEILGMDVARGYDSYISAVDAKMALYPIPDTRAIYPLYQGISWMLTTDADKLDAEGSDNKRSQLVLPFLAGVHGVS